MSDIPAANTRLQITSLSHRAQGSQRCLDVVAKRKGRSRPARSRRRPSLSLWLQGSSHSRAPADARAAPAAVPQCATGGAERKWGPEAITAGQRLPLLPITIPVSVYDWFTSSATPRITQQPSTNTHLPAAPSPRLQSTARVRRSKPRLALWTAWPVVSAPRRAHTALLAPRVIGAGVNYHRSSL